ncbi:hypothetical protein ACHAXR_010899 [Thalassiosira sp. AJA248-18]
MQSSIYDSLTHDSAAAAESLSVMIQKEQSTYKTGDYLHPPMQDDATMITESDRMKIVDWCYSVVDQCQFERETVAIAMEIVDRFLSKPISTASQDMLRGRKKFQLLAMTALYIAIKTNEKAALGSVFFSSLSHGEYSVDDIEAMELTILKGLSWRICAPTSVQMTRLILSLVMPHVSLEESTWGFILDEVQFQTESALRDYYFTAQRRSTIAMAAIFNTVAQVEEKNRQALLRALMLVMKNEDFEALEHLVAAKSRLKSVVECNGAIAEEGTTVSKPSRAAEDNTVASESPRKNESCSPKRVAAESLDDQKASKKCARTEPRTVSPIDRTYSGSCQKYDK